MGIPRNCPLKQKMKMENKTNYAVLSECEKKTWDKFDMSKIDDTQRLDFILSNNIEWLGYANHPQKGDYWELQIWDRGECEAFEAKTHRECIDKAIKSEGGRGSNWK